MDPIRRLELEVVAVTLLVALCTLLVWMAHG